MLGELNILQYLKYVLRPVGIREVLLVIVLSTLVKFFFGYWKRKQMFNVLNKFHQPKSLPFLGVAHLFMFSKNTGDILRILHKLLAIYPPPTSTSLGHHKFYITTDPYEIDTILNHAGAYQKVDMYKSLEPLVGTGLFTAPATKWKRMRKIIYPAFNQTILNSYITVYAEKSEQLVKHLKNHVGKGFFDVFHIVDKCTLDIICETAMGISVNAFESNFNYGALASRALEIAFHRMFKILYQIDFIYKFSALAKEEKEILTKIHNFTGGVIKTRKEEYKKKIEERKNKTYAPIENNKTKKKAFLDLLLELTENADITEEELRYEVETFMVAGSDTTATVASFTLVMLGMHPEIQEKVFQEIMDVIGPDRLVEQYDLPLLKYTEMVLKETMRLYPVAPLMARILQSDIKLQKMTLPEGVSVMIPIYYIHRMDKYWPEPLKFNPNRFTPEETSIRHPYTWLPFSGGTRNCIGLRFAMMSLKTIIATVIRTYTIKTTYKSVEEIKVGANLVIKPEDGYNCSVELRKQY